jgi:hypothetical protein
MNPLQAEVLEHVKLSFNNILVQETSFKEMIHIYAMQNNQKEANHYKQLLAKLQKKQSVSQVVCFFFFAISQFSLVLTYLCRKSQDPKQKK